LEDTNVDDSVEQEEENITSAPESEENEVEEEEEIKEKPRSFKIKFRFGRPIRARTTSKPAVSISDKDRRVLLKKLFGSRKRDRKPRFGN